MRVSDIASTTVVTVDVGASLAEAVGRMLDADVGSAVVTDDGAPGGIVTESDVLSAAYRSGEPLSSIPVRAAASAPLHTIGPSATVRRAAEKLGEHDVHRLVVVDGLDVVGVVSTTDLIRNYAGIREDERRRADAEHDWLTRENIW
ncbi:CBS domain-containing protein [Halobellus rufus]|uniref:CBS domain-containing protein n=1 Tax=Halobellus rufus TaxID=1448860 RepID=UPI00067900AB|nr:CBS domain-containing protein [Halobellus rufus]